jgi:hypothetical protein
MSDVLHAVAECRDEARVARPLFVTHCCGTLRTATSLILCMIIVTAPRFTPWPRVWSSPCRSGLDSNQKSAMPRLRQTNLSHFWVHRQLYIYICVCVCVCVCVCARARARVRNKYSGWLSSVVRQGSSNWLPRGPACPANSSHSPGYNTVSGQVCSFMRWWSYNWGYNLYGRLFINFMDIIYFIILWEHFTCARV